MINTQEDENLHPMSKNDTLTGMQLALKIAKKRLDNTKLLLESDNPYDIFIQNPESLLALLNICHD